MTPRPDILCIGSVLWDIIGRTDLPMIAGNDKPGRITRLPGGVALNIAMTLAAQGLRPGLLSVVGDDAAGTALLVECGKMGLGVEHVLVDHDLPTDQYMAIESEGRLLAAIADAHSLEAAGARILAPLSDGRLGTPDAPWRGAIALDGNLTVELLSEIAQSAVFAAADLRLAPASPGKADRLRPFLGHPRATFYVNAEEAGLIAGVATADARSGADALLAAGAARALVTDGANAAVDAKPERLLALTPPRVTARRVTGAGDTFMAAHIAAETRGAQARAVLSHALESAAAYVAG